MTPHADRSSTRNLPALQELQRRPQWVCWRKEPRKGKLTKVPYNPMTGKRAESDNPATWVSYAHAHQALHAGTYHGVGYMFCRDYTGIDLDHCVSRDGAIDLWAQAYLDRLKSYAEYSPSHTGIHILVHGTIKSGIRRRVPDAPHPEAAIEMYCEKRYFTVTGQHLAGTPPTIETCLDLQAIHAELTGSRPAPHPARTEQPGDLSDTALVDKAMRAKNGATFGALWHGDCSGYPSQSEAELALCTLLAFWTAKDATRMDRLFRRCALYREKWDQPARSGETYGQGTIARAIAACTEVYRSQRESKVIPFRRGSTPSGEDRELPETDVHFILDCLRDEEEGDARLYAHLFRGRCIYDHTEGDWYEWRGHYWERDERKHSLLLASGPLARMYLQASAMLSEEAAEAEKQLDPNLLKGMDSQQERYHWLKAITGKLIERAKALKKLKRAQAVLTYAQAFLSITSREWDSNPWLLGTREGVIDLKTGQVHEGKPDEYIRTIIPTAWHGLDTPAPRFEQYLREIFADREEAERDVLIAFLQRALGYGITSKVNEHIFLMLYGEEGRNGKDTLMTVLHRVLGSTVGAVSNDVIIASGKFSTPGSAKPHLCALQGKRIAWASETDKGARFDVGQVKFLTGGGDIPARQLYGRDYTFEPSHLLILLTNNKPHADAKDSAFWDRLCLVIFNLRFVDQPLARNERQRDTTLAYALETEASGILAWLVRGCLAWQQQGLQIPTSVLLARRDYREEEDTLGQFLKACCVMHERARVKASRLYERYKERTLANNLKAMNGNAFGLEVKKLYEQKRSNEGMVYYGIGLPEECIPPVYPQDGLCVGSVGTFQRVPSAERENVQRESVQEMGTLPTHSSSLQSDQPVYPPNEGLHSVESPSEATSSASTHGLSVGSAGTFRKVPSIGEENVQRESLREMGTLPTLSPSSPVDKAALEAGSAACSPSSGGEQGTTRPQEWEEFIL